MSVEDNIEFNMPKTQSNTIKVIGVGGGGSNAVNHMFLQQIKGVDFVICNTDAQALENSPIPNKIQLGVSLTSGLGAGANPEIGAQAAKESLQEIQQMLNTKTKMVFITAGMGGGTGTGAAPIIAKIAKDMDILTVGIVTIPFAFEGKRRTKQAQLGIDQLRENVDSLIVINNNKLREVYGNLGFKAGFSKADEVLSTASRGIAQVITHHYKQNIDLHDAKAVLSNSGTAIMGSAKEEGEERAKMAIIKALDSPLLNDNKITGAKNVLLLIISGTNEVTLDEIGEINDFIQDEAGYDANIIMGIGEDEELGEAISLTIVATGFAADQQSNITNTETKKIVHTLEDEQKATYNFSEEKISKIDKPLEEEETNKIFHVLEEDETSVSSDIKTNKEIIDVDVNKITYDDDNETTQDFIFNTITPEIEEPIVEEEEEVQQDLLFNFPLNDSENNEELVESSIKEEIKNIEDVEFVAKEIVEDKKEEAKEKRYTLSDFDSQPTIGKSSTILDKKEDKEEEEIQFTVKKISKEEEDFTNVNIISDEASPLDLTLAQVQERAAYRRSKFMKMNHKFSENINTNIDEIEKQPAYKRQGLDLKTGAISKSKTTLKKNDDDLGLSSNTYLHDNVD